MVGRTFFSVTLAYGPKNRLRDMDMICINSSQCSFLRKIWNSTMQIRDLTAIICLITLHDANFCQFAISPIENWLILLIIKSSQVSQ